MNTDTTITKRPIKRAAKYLAVLMIALGVGIPSVVAHTGAFTDVPHGAPFHDETNAMRSAGITSGCTATTYCPNDAVTRGQMAAFMKRGFGSVDRESGLGALPFPEGVFIVDSSEVVVPGAATSGALQFVKVDAKIEIAVSGTACDCDVVVFMTDESGNSVSDGSFYQFNESSPTTQTMTDSWVFAAAPGTQEFLLWVQATDNNEGTELEFNSDFVRLIATTHPFGSLEAGFFAAQGTGGGRTSRIDAQDIQEAIQRRS